MIFISFASNGQVGKEITDIGMTSLETPVSFRKGFELSYRISTQKQEIVDRVMSKRPSTDELARKSDKVGRRPSTYEYYIVDDPENFASESGRRAMTEITVAEDGRTPIGAFAGGTPLRPFLPSFCFSK